jgi:putative sterol carrier protein
MRFVVEPGNVDVMIGASSADIRLSGAFEIVGDVVEVLGNRAFLSEAKATGQVGISEAEVTISATPRPRPVAPTEGSLSPEAEPSGEEDTASPEMPVAAVLDSAAKQLDGKRPDLTTTIKFDVTGEGFYRLIVEDGACRLEEGDGEAEVTLRMKARHAVKIMTGKMNPMIAMATGRLKIEGNVQRLMMFQELMG